MKSVDRDVCSLDAGGCGGLKFVIVTMSDLINQPPPPLSYPITRLGEAGEYCSIRLLRLSAFYSYALCSLYLTHVRAPSESEPSRIRKELRDDTTPLFLSRSLLTQFTQFTNNPLQQCDTEKGRGPGRSEYPDFHDNISLKQEKTSPHSLGIESLSFHSPLDSWENMVIASTRP
jgi:hypothetical protein